MAVVVTVGRVQHLKVSSGYGFVNIRLEKPSGPTLPPMPSSPPNELLIIWFGIHGEESKDIFRAELSRALAHGLRVRIFHEDTIAYISDLVVEAPFEGALV